MGVAEVYGDYDRGAMTGGLMTRPTTAQLDA
jgi:hypothetical protein